MIISGMTENHKKEALSRAYVHAIAAKAGVSITTNTTDYGVDVTFNEIQCFEGQIMEAGATFKCQLKSTKNWTMDDKFITYKIKVDAYNRLVGMKKLSTIPSVLILLCLPPNPNEWHEMCEEYLKIKRCCYWLHWQKEDVTQNKSNTSIQFPREQLFTPDALISLLQKFGRGDR